MEEIFTLSNSELQLELLDCNSSCSHLVQPYLYHYVHTVNASSQYFVFKQLKIEGFIVMRWLPKWPVAFKEMVKWMQEVCS
jgi:NADPH-dependent curcumin reductase CurA